MNFADIRVVAVVVTYNRPKELLSVVHALHNQSRAPDQILIFDNASYIPASTTISGFTGVTVIRTEVNSGGAGGFAAGIECAMEYAPDWVWLLDDDAVPRVDALEQLLKVSLLLPNGIGALCPAVYEFGMLALVHRRNFLKLVAWERSIKKKRYSDGPLRIDTGSFVGYLLNAHAVKSVGFPNPSFFLAYDDTEYSLRLVNAGFTIWLIPDSKIDHLRLAGTRLRSTPFGVKHFYNVRNRLAVAIQHARCKLTAACLATLTGFAIWVVCGGAKHPRSVKLYFKAVKDGFGNNLGKFQ